MCSSSSTTCDLYDKDSTFGDRTIAIARQGLSYGVHVVTSASGWLIGQKQALLGVSNARIQLRLSNPDETQMGSRNGAHRRAARHTGPGAGLRRHAPRSGAVDRCARTDRVGRSKIATRQIGEVLSSTSGAERLARWRACPSASRCATSSPAMLRTTEPTTPQAFSAFHLRSESPRYNPSRWKRPDPEPPC